MAKEFPYFKFYVGEWLLGSISSENYRTQGIFIRACALYWKEKTKQNEPTLGVNLSDFSKKLGKTQVTLLQNSGHLKTNEERINIPFLDEQYLESLGKSNINAKNGSKGGQANAKRTLSEKEAKVKHLDIELDKDIELDIELDTTRKNLEQNLEEIYNSQKWIETVLMNEKINRLEFEKIFQFFKKKVLITNQPKTISDLRGWFASWLPGNKDKILQSTIEIPKNESGQIDYDKLDYNAK